LLISFLFASSVFAIEPDSVLGTWLSEKKDGIIQVTKNEDQYQGHLIWILNIHNGKETEILDVENPDKDLRARSIQGIKLFYGFSFDEDEWTGGTIYDPESGNTYRSYIYLEGQ